MKQYYPHISISKLCKLFGLTRHAWYDNKSRQQDQSLKDEIIIQMVFEIRKQLPGTGTRKLLHLLEPELAQHGLQAGRDYLFHLLAEHKLLIRCRKRKVITTDSRHWMHKYTNRVKELQINRPQQLWVSDITYIRLSNGFVYLSLVTDAYSRKIVGFNLHKNLSAEGCLIALQMALVDRIEKHLPLIHHSDRGSQYCCKPYVDLLCQHNIAISMTQNGDPYENAIAERLNGILKTEFNLYSSQFGYEQTCQLVKQSIINYNQIRPHASCDYLTPQQAHLISGELKKRWKNYYKAKIINP
jgi:transposase InsO family protein